MTLEQFRRVLNDRPFRPFAIDLADGRSIRVEHPEIVAIIPPGRTIFVAPSESESEFVDMLLVTRLKQQSNGSRRGRGKRPPE